jgi:hypothetical protein
MAKVPLIVVRFEPWHTTKSPLCRTFWASAHGKESIFAVCFFTAHGKEPIFAVRFSRRTAKGVTRRLILSPSVVFFAVLHEKMHGKDYLLCVVSHGARQRGFTVQNATVCPLSCAPTKNARQRVYRAF